MTARTAAARPTGFERLRARLAGAARPPWLILLLVAGDLIELAASIALAVLTPSPAAAPRVPYPVVDVPYAAPALTMGVATVGIVAGVLLGLSLAGELYVLFRRAQIRRWRARAALRAAAAARSARRAQGLISV